MSSDLENSFFVAVLITCHNRREKTLACLAALYTQVGLNIDFKYFII